MRREIEKVRDGDGANRDAHRSERQTGRDDDAPAARDRENTKEARKKTRPSDARSRTFGAIQALKEANFEINKAAARTMKSMSSSDALTAKAARLDALAPARRTAAPRTDALAESTRGLKVTAAMWKVGGVAESGCPTVDESAKTRRVARGVARSIESLLFERFFFSGMRRP